MGRDLRIQQRLDGRPRHDEVIENGMVREDERTDGVGLPVQLHLPGCRPDAAFQAVAAHPAPGSNGTLGKIGPAVSQRGKDMLFGYMQAPDVVQAAVVALADDRVHAAGGLTDVRITLQHVLHQRRLHGAHTEGIGEQDRRFQRPQLVDLDQAGRLAETVDDMAGRQHLIVEHIARMRQQSRHAGLDIAVRQCAVPHRHARHIADLVPGAVRQSADPEAPFVRFDSHCSILLWTSAFIFRVSPAPWPPGHTACSGRHNSSASSHTAGAHGRASGRGAAAPDRRRGSSSSG